jgi:UDP-glucose:(glucosyl)LPS alpha-1,2-glucosyltransferase
MPIDYLNDLTRNANGGTEQMARALESRLSPELLDKFQIIPSRVRELDQTRIRIFWAHDLPGDLASEHLKHSGYQQYERLVFVSNWQMQAYVSHYQIPWSKCLVLQNAIVPIEPRAKPPDRINFIYHTTPHRGLHLLVAVFKKLVENHHNIHLDVYSSFKIYGWEQRDEPFKPLFKVISDDLNMTYHGAVPNDEVRAALRNAHIFAYPSIWPETSCIALIEAMSAGLLCVHPNYAALPETAANWTWMYQYNENQQEHANQFYSLLDGVIRMYRADDGGLGNRLQNQSNYIRTFYNWELRSKQWELFLNSILELKKHPIAAR